MSTDDNIKTIATLYEAFGRGDVQTVLDGLTDDIDWAAETTSTAAAWFGARHGKDEVAAFFQEFGAGVEIQEFTPITFAGNGTDVLTVVRCRATVRATGKTIAMDLHHYFKFQDGKVAYYRGTEDSAQTEAALRP